LIAFIVAMESLTSTQEIRLLTGCSEEEARVVGVALFRITFY